jgi:hypothetical protein
MDSTVLWLVEGGALVLGLSVLLAIALTAILRSVGREVSEFLESEEWSGAQPVRAAPPRLELLRDDYGRRARAN